MEWRRLWSVESGWGWLSSGSSAGAIELAMAAVLGLVFGSFVNVVIHRLPRNESVVWPRSRCPACHHALTLWENLPVLSFVLLAGRCRECRGSISWRYPLVELACGFTATVAVMVLGVSTAALGAGLFVIVLLAVAWIDAEHRIIPNQLSIALLVIGLGVRGLSAEAIGIALVGAVMGFSALAAVAWGYRRVRGVDGLGGGDIKLAAGLGAFLGPPGLLLTVMLAALVGSVIGIALVASGRGSRFTALPFGSFLAPAAVVVMILGPILWRAYLGLAGLDAF